MVNEHLRFEHLDPLLKELRAARPKCVGRAREAVNELILTLEELAGFGASEVGDPVKPDTAAPKSIPTECPYYGLGLAEAGMKFIRMAKKPQLPSDMWAAMKKSGIEIEHRDPVNALRHALSRRAKKHEDVMLVGGGKWDLSSNYTQVERERIASELGGMPAREAKTHSRKTSDGMRRAAASRGVRMGQKPKITEEMARKIKRIIDAGETGRAAAEAVGVSHSTVYNWREDIEAWTPGEPWPPQQRARSNSDATPDDDERSAPLLKVVK